jgi:hypothetical protein
MRKKDLLAQEKASSKRKSKNNYDYFPDECLLLGMDPPIAEYRFCPPRRFRIDFAWPDIKLAVEIEGGLYIGGRHTSVTGFKKDLEKYNLLTDHGWVLLRYEPNRSKEPNNIDFLQILRVYENLNAMKRRLTNNYNN